MREKKAKKEEFMKEKRLKFQNLAGCFIMLICLAALFSLPAFAEELKYDFPEGAAEVNIELDGRRILDGEAAIIDSVTYVPLRSFSELCGAEDIGWDHAGACNQG